MLLARNEESVVSGGGALVVERLPSRDLESLTARTDKRMILDGMTLARAVREFNRYNAMQLRLADAEAGGGMGLKFGLI